MHLFISIFLSFFVFLVVNSAQSMRQRTIENPERPVEFLLNWVVTKIGSQGEMNTFLRSLYTSENCPTSFAKCYSKFDTSNVRVKTSQLLNLLESGLGEELPKLLKHHTFNLGFHINVPNDIKKILDDIPVLESIPEKSKQQQPRRQISFKPKIPVRKAEVRYNQDFDSDRGTCPDMYQVGTNSWVREGVEFGILGLPSNIRVVQETDDPEKAEWTRQLTDEEVEEKRLVNFMPLVHSNKESGKKDDTLETD